MIRIFVAAILHLISSFTPVQDSTMNTDDQVIIGERLTAQSEPGFIIEGITIYEDLHTNLFETGVEGRFNWTGKLRDHNYQRSCNGYAFKGIVFQASDLRFDLLKFDVNDKDLTFEIGF